MNLVQNYNFNISELVSYIVAILIVEMILSYYNIILLTLTNKLFFLTPLNI
jgi:hypothetical protein